MEKQYAKAIDRLIRERGMDEKKVFTQLEEHLRTTGRIKLLPLLLTELKKLQEHQDTRISSLEAASEGERKEAEAAARKEGVDSLASINRALISGWRLRSNGTLIDRSGKRALVDLYRRITA